MELSLVCEYRITTGGWLFGMGMFVMSQQRCCTRKYYWEEVSLSMLDCQG